MTRLEILCILHKQSGGTIHQFNSQYETDFLLMSDLMFEVFLLSIKYHNKKEVSK